MATRGKPRERSGKQAPTKSNGSGRPDAGAEGEVDGIMRETQEHAVTSGGHRHTEIHVTRSDPTLADSYGDNHIYAMVRDPRWLYSYWEIQAELRERALERLGGSWDGVTTVLRVHDAAAEEVSCDVSLPPGARNWYVNVAPNRSYYLEIGLLHRDGRFIPLARSNTVSTPRAGMSEVIDEHWMGIDFDAMYALSGGLEAGRSSAELQKIMEERLQAAITSGSGVGAVSSLSSPARVPGRGFWFMLDCELIVYGATEPDAKVTLQGKEVPLRPDGTFTLRFALPDGSHHLDATAQSADGKETRTIVPVVTRTTHVPEPLVVA